MLEQLKFVQGSVAKKDFIAELTHFCIEHGTVRGYNGTIALCSPIPFDIACKPKAETLVRAIANCSETVQLALTPAGRLSIKSGAFKTFVDCVQGETPHAVPEGAIGPIDGAALIQCLKTIQRFIGSDASRPWANGVLLRDGCAYATNNVTLVQYWLGPGFPSGVNIPAAAVKELLRIGEAPVQLQVAEHCVTFHYDGRRWLRTQLLPADWPDLGPVLERPSAPVALPEKLFEGLAAIDDFVDKLGRVYFREGMLCTTPAADTEGASYRVDGLPADGIYNAQMLWLLQDVAKVADFSAYPGPVMFYGERLRGAIIGMRS